jgi:nucleotide-binding universal stress UspA family protein
MTEEAATATSQISAVLHPTDLTSSSELAFAHALRLAASGRTKLYLLHADPSAEDTDWSAYPAVRRTLASWGMLDESSLPSVVFDQLGVQVAKVRIPAARRTGCVLFLARRREELFDKDAIKTGG